jgi:transposase
MDEQDPRLIPGINADDWEQTPARVREGLKQLVLKVDRLEQRLKELEIENQQLREKVERNSKNSHSPPASDAPNVEKTQKKKPTGKKRGGQAGHPGHSCPLYPVEECTRVTDY